MALARPPRSGAAQPMPPSGTPCTPSCSHSPRTPHRHLACCRRCRPQSRCRRPRSRHRRP
eukprot:1095795-Prymnesium_polylepis.1